MNLEQQVVSLELSSRLNELGVKQDSLFCWVRWIPKKGSSFLKPEWKISIYKNSMDDYERCSAFTVAELGEMLPDCIYATSASENDRPIFMNKVDDVYSVAVLNANQSFYPRFCDNKEADARAKILIHLIENQLWKLE